MSKDKSKNSRGHLVDVGQNSERLGIVESSRGIEAASRIVPHLSSKDLFSRARKHKTRAEAKTHHLGDRDTLALPSRDSAHRRRADLGVLGVRDAEHA